MIRREREHTSNDEIIPTNTKDGLHAHVKSKCCKDGQADAMERTIPPLSYPCNRENEIVREDKLDRAQRVPDTLSGVLSLRTIASGTWSVLSLALC